MNNPPPDLIPALAELDRAHELLALLLKLDDAGEVSEEDAVLCALRDHLDAARALLANATGRLG